MASKAFNSAPPLIQTQIKNDDLVKKKQLQIAIGASKLFIKKGYQQTSIREISKAAGLSVEICMTI